MPRKFASGEAAAISSSASPLPKPTSTRRGRSGTGKSAATPPSGRVRSASAWSMPWRGIRRVSASPCAFVSRPFLMTNVRTERLVSDASPPSRSGPSTVLIPPAPNLRPEAMLLY